MKIIIFGANGMLGNYVKKYFQQTKHNIIAIDRKDYDIMKNDFNYLENLLVTKEIDENTVVFNAIGTIPHAAKNYDLNNKIYIKVNTLFPNILSQICMKYNAKMIHPTTDCVFTGNTGKYNENDEHDANDIYGITKSLGENNGATVIRTSIIGDEIQNKRSLVEWVKSNKNGQINGFINHYWNGITCLQFAKVLEHIIEYNLFWKGVRHIYSPRTVNKYELLNIINDTYDLNIEISKKQTDSCDKSISSLYPETNNLFCIPDLKEQIKEMNDFLIYL